MKVSQRRSGVFGASGEQRSLEGKRVLLAEDDEGARKVMATVLRSMGLDAVETADGGRMLVAIASLYKNGHTPAELDLVVTDVQMPVVRGLDVFKGLRAAGWTTPVIIVTGFETAEVSDAVARFGAVLLSKPLDLDEFEHTVRELLTRPRSVGGRLRRG